VPLSLSSIRSIAIRVRCSAGGNVFVLCRRDDGQQMMEWNRERERKCKRERVREKEVQTASQLPCTRITAKGTERCKEGSCTTPWLFSS